MEEYVARLRAHRNNITRSRRLLRTKLSPLERQFIERRLSEEEAELAAIASSTFPLTFPDPKAASEIAR